MACHLHTILCTWDTVTTCTPAIIFFPLGVRLGSFKKKKKKKKERTLIVPATCLPSNQLRKYTPILLIAHKLSNAKSRYLLLASFPAPCWACCRLQHQVRLGNEASCISWKCPAQTADSLEQGHSLAMCLGSKPARLQFQHSWFGSTPIIT